MAGAEAERLEQDARRERNWKRWGPYLAERQWGTVREDYSGEGNVWGYFSHDRRGAGRTAGAGRAARHRRPAVPPGLRPDTLEPAGSDSEGAAVRPQRELAGFLAAVFVGSMVGGLTGSALKGPVFPATTANLALALGTTATAASQRPLLQ
jgi:hypothetical protein